MGSMLPKKLPRDATSIVIGTVYHPHWNDRAADRRLTNHITDALDKIIAAQPHDAIFVTGDFNDFTDSQIVKNFNLKQVVTFPTRKNACLDKIYTNCSHRYQIPYSIGKLATSDNEMVLYRPNHFQVTPGVPEIITKRVTGANEKAMFKHD